MVKIYPYQAGRTLESHKKLLKKLTKKGARKGKSADGCDTVIIFCPIVSRFETDINSAIEAARSDIDGFKNKKVIMVAMHHTFDPDYTVPSNSERDPVITLLVHCLFYENKGLLSCRRNKKAYKAVCKELGLRGILNCFK